MCWYTPITIPMTFVSRGSPISSTHNLIRNALTTCNVRSSGDQLTRIFNITPHETLRCSLILLIHLGNVLLINVSQWTSFEHVPGVRSVIFPINDVDIFHQLKNGMGRCLYIFQESEPIFKIFCHRYIQSHKGNVICLVTHTGFTDNLLYFVWNWFAYLLYI